MAALPPVTITGQAETIAALLQVGDFDREAAARIAGENLIPYIAAGTRILSGMMQASWMADGEYIRNEMEYAVIQEYGSVYVTPTHAIRHAAEMYPDALIDGYSEVIEDAAEQAGFVDI